MRNFVIIFAILFPTFFTSCIDQSPKVTNYEIQTIDSCEYIVSYWSKSRNMTHKGNCKYCQVRSQKVIVDILFQSIVFKPVKLVSKKNLISKSGFFFLNVYQHI